MKTLEKLRQQIKSVEDMRSVVSTMKTLAAARIRQYESAEKATRHYAQTIDQTLHALMLGKDVSQVGDSSSTQPERFGLILFGSDQGFCGRFNEAVMQSAIPTLQKSSAESIDSPVLLTVGTRLQQLLDSQGFSAQESLRLPNSVAKISELIQQVIVTIERWQSSVGVSQVIVFYNKRVSHSSYAAKQVQLLPISSKYLAELSKRPWVSRARPISPIPWHLAFSRAIGQFLFLRLFRACTQSLASENASRIAAMQKAESNIDEKFESLSTQFHQARQRSVTEELLEIISGSTAVAD